MSITMAINRLKKELKRLHDNPVRHIIAVPDQNSLFEWNFLIYGLENSQYTDGYYHGIISFPKEYPYKPPSIKFKTPSGRFKINTQICLSYTNFHPESWNPAWTIETMLVGLIAFMNSEEKTNGSMEASASHRRRYAKMSMLFNLKDEHFIQLFQPFFETLNINPDRAIALSKERDTKVEQEEAATNSKYLIIALAVIVIAVLLKLI